MPTSLDTHQRTSLREFLVSRFSLEELKDVAFDLKVDYQNIPHNTLGELARELIAQTERIDNVKELVHVILHHRPDEELSAVFRNFLNPDGSVNVKYESIDFFISDEDAVFEIIQILFARNSFDVQEIKRVIKLKTSLYQKQAQLLIEYFIYSDYIVPVFSDAEIYKVSGRGRELYFRRSSQSQKE